MELEDSWVIRRAYGFTLQKENEDSFLLASGDGYTTVQLNQTGALIWQLVDDQRSVLEISALLQELYPEGAEAVDEQTRRMLRDLIDYGAVFTLM